MLTEKDAVQKEKDSYYKEIRHLCSLCTCPSYVTIVELKYILSVLKGEEIMSTMHLVMVDRWGSYGCEEPYMVFHSYRSAQECVESMNNGDPRDCYSLHEVEVGYVP